MAPKKKGQKMDLSSFLADTATGNWADEMEDMPIAPTPKDPNAPKRGDPGYFDSIPDRGASRYGASGGATGGQGNERFQREELPLPTKPPYTAFVGNLSFEVGEEELSQFFEGLETVSSKIIKGHDEKPKGFGYVEFKSLDDLKAGLERTGGQMDGRSVRVSVAEPPKSSGFGGGFGGPSMADTADQWRRSGPLPARTDTRAPARSNNRYESEGGRDDAPSPIDRDWGAARGSRFTANAEPPALRRGDSGMGGERGFVPARGAQEGGLRDRGPIGGTPIAETPDDWRSNRPARAPAPPAQAPVALGKDLSAGGPRGGRGGFMDREPVQLTGAAAEDTWSRGTKFTATEPAPPKPEIVRKESLPVTPRVELEQSNWRSSKPVSKEPTPTSSAQASPHPSRAQPLAAAPPNPEAEEKAKRVESDWRSNRPERKVVEERKKPVVEEKEKAEGAAPATAPATSGGPAPPRGLAMNRGGRAAAGGNFPKDLPRRGAEGGWRRAPPAAVPPPVAVPATASAKAPKVVQESVIDEDGFMIASGPGARKQSAQTAPRLTEKKAEGGDSAKGKFSFAKASGMDDLVEGEGNEDVEGVTKGVDDVKV